MKIRILQCLVLLTALAFTACPTTDPKKNSKKAAKTAEHPTSEENADVDFQAFVGRLRKAVKAHDVNTIAAMMTPGWDENGLWTELDGILSERFVQKEGYMVSPPQFADPAADYTGYRVGIRRENGSWKFVYFVNG